MVCVPIETAYRKLNSFTCYRLIKSMLYIGEEVEFLVCTLMLDINVFLLCVVVICASIF